MRCCVGLLVQGTRIFNTICDTWSTRDSPVSRRPRRRPGCLWCRTTAPCTALASPGIDDVTPSGGHKISAKHATLYRKRETCTRMAEMRARSPVPHSDYGTTSHVSTAVTAGVLCYAVSPVHTRRIWGTTEPKLWCSIYPLGSHPRPRTHTANHSAPKPAVVDTANSACCQEQGVFVM